MELPKDIDNLDKVIDLLQDRKDAIAWRCSNPLCDGEPHSGREYRHARGKQVPPWARYITLQDTLPEGEKLYRRWYARGGRGSGKTYAGSHSLAELIVWLGGVDNLGDRREYGVVGPTFKYAKETLIEGGSGLINALGGNDSKHIASYNMSTGTLILTNGAIVYTAGADNFGKSIEGKNLSAVWLDEVGLWSLRRWKYTWENAIRFAVRKDPALFIITGTPKEGHPFVKELVSDNKVYTVVMSTKENKALPEEVVAEYEAMYGGTRLGRQELEGEILNDIPGALWSGNNIENNRWLDIPDTDSIVKILIGWDPATTSNENSDEHGIIVAAQIAGDPAHYAILEDASGRYSPMEAINVIYDLYIKHKANSVVAETNNGGDMIEALIRTLPAIIPLVKVTATRGKRLRAEPIAAISEQGRLHLVGTYPKLEDQMTSWSPEQPGSPDRLDAMVWAVTALLEQGGKSRAYVGRNRISIRSK